jgi:hypothetical protein
MSEQLSNKDEHEETRWADGESMMVWERNGAPHEHLAPHTSKLLRSGGTHSACTLLRTIAGILKAGADLVDEGLWKIEGENENEKSKVKRKRKWKRCVEDQ